MQMYRQVTEAEPVVVAFLKAYETRLDPKRPPLGIMVAEKDQAVIAALLFWTDPYLCISVILGETAGAMTLTRLAMLFEKWAEEHGATQYGFSVHKDDHWYRRIVERRGATPTTRDEEGYVTYLQPLQPPVAWEADTVRSWRHRDWPSLSRLMRDFLAEHHKDGGDYPPTNRNVTAFVCRGLKAADDGDPALVAVREQKIVGFCLWTRLNADGLDVTKRVCLGLGTYVVPPWRRRRVATELRETAVHLAKGKYDRVDGIALTPGAWKAGEAVGVKMAGVFGRLSLE